MPVHEHRKRRNAICSQPWRAFSQALRPKMERTCPEGGSAMLDPIVNFFTWIFQWIGRVMGFVIGIILWPFMWAARWYTQRAGCSKASSAPPCWPGCLLRLFHLADAAVEQLQSRLSGCTQGWLAEPVAGRQARLPRRRAASAGETAVAGAPLNSTRAGAASGPGSTSTARPAAPATACQGSAIAGISADLIDFNVNQNAWISRCWPRKSGCLAFRGETPLSSTTRPLSSSA